MSNPGPQEGRAHSPLRHLQSRRLRILFTYTLSFFENICELLYPWAIGAAVNGLIAGDAKWIWPLIILWIVHVIIGLARQLYDTRLFSRLNADMSVRAVELQRAGGVSVGRISARVEMIEELIVFLEEDFPLILAATVNLLGALLFLFLYDGLSGLVFIGLFVPIAVINFATGRRAYETNKLLNSEWERQVNAINDRRKRRWRLHFGRMAKWRIRLSDLNAISWSSAQLLVMISAVFILLRSTSLPGFQAGDILAMLAYAFIIEQRVDEIPDIVQQSGRLADIVRRIKSPSSEEESR